MSVFFVHDVNHGIVKPLDRKFRVREINPVDEVSKSQKIHAKENSDPGKFQRISQKENNEQQRSKLQPSQDKAQKAIQTYQENIPESSKLNLGKVKDIMSDSIIKIFQDQSLADAWKVMLEHDISHLIILNDAFEYCGLLSEKTITPYLMRIAKNKALAFTPEALPLTQFCDKNLLSTHPETLIHDLGVAMLECGLDAVAVSENSKIIGIVTKSDILKVLLKHENLEELA